MVDSFRLNKIQMSQGAEEILCWAWSRCQSWQYTARSPIAIVYDWLSNCAGLSVIIIFIRRGIEVDVLSSVSRVCDIHDSITLVWQGGLYIPQYLYIVNVHSWVELWVRLDFLPVLADRLFAGWLSHQVGVPRHKVTNVERGAQLLHNSCRFSIQSLRFNIVIRIVTLLKYLCKRDHPTLIKILLAKGLSLCLAVVVHLWCLIISTSCGRD